MKKLCPDCNTEKKRADFAKDTSRKDGRYHVCKVCNRVRNNNRYQERYKEQRRLKDKQRAEKNIRFINEIKATSGCELCPEKEPACLDFHHRDPSEKDFIIAYKRNWTQEALMQEIKKCAILCANCHRKVHAGLIHLR